MRTTLLVGPVVGFALLAFVRFATIGPGAFFLTIAVALLLILVAPVSQLALGKSERFAARPWAAAGVAMAGIAVAAFALIASGVSNWW